MSPAAPLAPVVVTAARVEQSGDDSFAAVTVLEREAIDASQASDLPTLLRQQAGIEIAQLGGYGTQSGVFIRGAETRHTLVLVDGVPVSNLNFGLAPLEHLTLANVERIEIARGNLSSVYGSSALGGVVQIFTTAKGEGVRARGAMRIASRDTQLVQGAVSRSREGLSFGIDAAALRSGGINAIDQSERPGTNPDGDPYRNRNLGLFAAGENGPWKSELRWRRSQGTTAYDSQFGPPEQADESRFRVDVAHARLAHETADASHAVKLLATVDDLDAQTTAFPFFVKTRMRALVWDSAWRFDPRHRVNVGLEHARTDLSSDTEYTRTRRRQNTVRLGYLGEVDAHQWQLNVRGDHYSDFGSATTASAGYGYRLTPAWRASATLSTGFNAPSYNDLFYPFGGNPDLDAERSTNVELALAYRQGATAWRLTLFDSRYRDLIASDENFVRVNVARARVKGVEFTGERALGDWRLDGSLTLQDPQDTVGDERLPRRARALGGLGIGREWGGWRYGAHLRHAGRRFDDAANTRPMGGYTTLDVSARASLGSGWMLDAGVRNATDKRFETAYGYRQAGATASLTLGWTQH